MYDEDKEWLDYSENYYSTTYDTTMYKSSFTSRPMSAGHARLEKQFSEDTYFENVLEVGAGTGEHLKHVKHKFGQYILSDTDQKILDIAKKKHQYRENIIYAVGQAEKLSYENESFDRIIASHVLEHIYMPHLAIKEWRRLLKPKGVLSIIIPTDPGIAWQIARHLGTRRTLLKAGLPYDYIMAREHVNPCHNLIPLLRHYFPQNKECWWPFPFASINMNYFFIAHFYKE